MPPLPNTKNDTFSFNPNQAGAESFRAGGSGDQGTSGAGEEESRMDLGSSRVSHIHTLRVETGHQRVLQVAWMSQELFGSGARW